MQDPQTDSSKKLLNFSSLVALVAGGSIALLPLDSLIEQLVGVAICASLFSLRYLVYSHQPSYLPKS